MIGGRVTFVRCFCIYSDFLGSASRLPGGRALSSEIHPSCRVHERKRILKMHSTNSLVVPRASVQL